MTPINPNSKFKFLHTFIAITVPNKLAYNLKKQILKKIKLQAINTKDRYLKFNA